MATPGFLQSLTAELSPESRVLADENSAEFKASMNRWTNYDLKTPSAIVQPATETDVVSTVKKLVSASIPFVPSSGGHSCFSSIGKDGVIIDLSRFAGVEVDVANGLATVKGGTLMKELQAALHPHKYFSGQFGCHETTGNLDCSPKYSGW
jgi:FAD/FMN-containing dehydrogenase